MKESRPKNVPQHKARRCTPTQQPMKYEQEREEIAQIAMMLTDRRKIYYLLGVAEALLEIEAKQNPHIT